MAQQTSASESSWIRRHTIAFLGVFIITIVVIIAGFRSSLNPFVTWIVLLALFTTITVIISRAYTHDWLGILLDSRNKYSLSRFQMVLWTLIVLSAFIAAVLANIQLKLLVYVDGAIDPPEIFLAPSGTLISDLLIGIGVIEVDAETKALTVVTGIDLSTLNLAEPLKDGQHIYILRIGETPPTPVSPFPEEEQFTPTTPLSVQIPNEVWLLLGISTTSLVASPLIKEQKSDKLVKNQSTEQARLSDMFKGEESGNINILDLGKMQLLYITLIVIGAYAIALAHLFLSTQTSITALPGLDGGVVAMLGVSHAGYLSNKAVGSGKETPADPNLTASSASVPFDDQNAAG